MTAATALVSGNTPLPQLAEEAVVQALAKAGLTHANGVLLFLTPEFARHAQPVITAVARRAQCTQVAGGIASGVFTESGWTLDRPAAAVMVLGGGLSLGHAKTGEHPVLSYTAGSFPPDWAKSEQRFGGTFTGLANVEPCVWQQSRLVAQQRCSVQLLGADVVTGVSNGLHLLGTPQSVDACNGYDLEKLGGQMALDSLSKALPREFRPHTALPLHALTAVLIDRGRTPHEALAAGRYRPIALIAVNANHSLTLAEQVAPGDFLLWAIRQPVTAEADMQQTIDRLAEKVASPPAFALMFSCIGRGPYFYGGEDHDRDVLCARFPGLPLLGTYGTGQIAPSSQTQSGNRECQNAVVTALASQPIKDAHVQSIT